MRSWEDLMIEIDHLAQPWWMGDTKDPFHNKEQDKPKEGDDDADIQKS